MPKVVMISAFHLVFVQSASNNFKLWWSQLSPRIHTDYTTTTTSTTITTTNYDDPSCLLIPLLTISSDPPSRQEPNQMDVHRPRPLFPTHHFFFIFYFGSYKQKNAFDLYIVILHIQLPPTLLSLLSSHNFNWVFFYSLVAPPRGGKSKLALLLPQSPCHGTFLLRPGLSCTLVHPTSWCPAPCSPLWSLSASLARTFFCTLQPFRRSSHAHVQHQEIAFASHQVEKGVTDIYQGHLWGKRSKMKYKLTLYSSLKCECAILIS